MSAVVRHSSTASKDVSKVLVRQPGGKVRYNDDGSLEATERFRCLYTVALAQAPIRNVTAHPLFTGLICQTVEIAELEAGMSEVTVTFIGDASNDGGVISTSRLPKPSYELITEASEQPIETFPDFKAVLGTSENGAKYDPNGLFLGFAASSSFAGIAGFLSAGVVWRETGMRRTKPTQGELSRVGYIDTPTGWQTPPPVESPRNWLLRAMSYTYEGKIYRYQKEWLLSGPNGWKYEIYI